MTRALDQLADAARAARPTLPTPTELQKQMSAPIGIGRIFEEVLSAASRKPSQRSFRLPDVSRRP